MPRHKGGSKGASALNRDGHTIGLDIGATAIRAAVLAPKITDGRPSVTMHGIGHIALPPGVVVNGVILEPAALTAALKQLWAENKFACRRVILGIANQQVLVRDMEVPDLSPQLRAKALPFQAREIVALPIDQVVLDYCQLSAVDPDSNLVRGLLLATPREPLLAAVTAVEKAGLKVARVDLAAFGLLRSVGDDHAAVEAIVDLGAHLTTIVIHDHGVPKLVRTLARGGEELTRQLSDRMGTSMVEAERAKCDVGLIGDDKDMTRMLTDAMRPLVAEIRTSVQYFRSTNSGAVIDRMCLTGGGSALLGISVAFENQIGLTAHAVDPMRHVRNGYASKHSLPDDAIDRHGAVSIGLAMGLAA